MKKYVIDTSVITRYFIGDDDRYKVKRLMLITAKGRIKLYAPRLLWYEFYSVMVQVHASKSDALKATGRFEKMLDNKII
jgi:predicted nucleic acid-binding protein